jgi:NADPH:quinone reductase-like Zn-dependent oxidoreductase
MHAVLLTGLGGFDKLDYRTDVSVPKLKAGEVLIRVRASAVNDTTSICASAGTPNRSIPTIPEASF